jgi:MFS family permease
MLTPPMPVKTKNKGIRIFLLFWFSFMGLSAINPFFSLYLKKVLVLGNGQPLNMLIGILLFLQSFLSLFSNPAAGYLADKFRAENRVLFFCALFVVGGGVLIAFPSLMGFSGLAIEIKILFIGAGILLTGLFFNPVYPLIASETLEYLHSIKKPASYFGRFRVSASLSWIINTALVGLLLLLVNNVWLIMIYFCAGLALLSLAALPGLKARVTPVKVPWDHLRRNKPFQRLLIFSFIFSFGIYGAFNFTAYFFDDYHLNYLLMGLAFSFATIPEIPVMYFSAALSKRLGNFKMIVIGTGLLVIKNILLALLTPLGLTVLVLAANFLHGFGFGLQTIGLVNLIDKWSHKNMRAIYMNLFQMIGINLPMALGALGSSFLIQFLGSQWMIIINMALSISAILYFIIRLKDKAEEV